MFHNVGPHSNPYGAYSNAGASQAPAPRPAEPASQQESVARFVNTVKEQGVVPGMTSLPSGIPANRDAHVRARVHAASRQHVASRMGMSKEQFVSDAVTSFIATLPAHLSHHTRTQATAEATAQSEQAWAGETADLAEGWNNSDAHRQTIVSATQEWNRDAIACATELAQQSQMEQARGPSSSPVRQPGADSRAAALRNAYASERNVFDEAFGAALAASPGSSGVNALTGQFAHLSSGEASESSASPGAGVENKGKRKADALAEPGESENKRGKRRASTASEEPVFLPDASPGSPRDGEWEVAPEHYRDLDRRLEHGADNHGAGSAPRAQTASPGLATSDDAAAPQAPGIPPSREGSVDRLIGEVSTAAQKQKASNQAPRCLTRFSTGLDALNAKDGRSRIDPEQGLARYKEQSKNRQAMPAEIRNQTAELAKKLGVGDSAADYNKHQKAELAKKLGVGDSAADYKKHQAAELAKKLGVGDSAADYKKHRAAERKKQDDQEPGSGT